MTPQVQEQMEIAVAKGAALLNERAPGWEEKVQRGWVDMSRSHTHVLAWAFDSNYTCKGYDFLFRPHATDDEQRGWGIEHGFSTPVRYWEEEWEDQHAYLTRLWDAYVRRVELWNVESRPELHRLLKHVTV